MDTGPALPYLRDRDSKTPDASEVLNMYCPALPQYGATQYIYSMQEDPVRSPCGLGGSVLWLVIHYAKWNSG